MSQHFYEYENEAGRKFIMAGWNKPLGYFFLVITDQTNCDEDLDGIIYSNLLDPDAGTSQTENFYYFSEVLKKLDIHLPDGMIKEIELDRQNNVGNKIVDWNEAP